MTGLEKATRQPRSKCEVHDVLLLQQLWTKDNSFVRIRYHSLPLSFLERRRFMPLAPKWLTLIQAASSFCMQRMYLIAGAQCRFRRFHGCETAACSRAESLSCLVTLNHHLFGWQNQRCRVDNVWSSSAGNAASFWKDWCPCTRLVGLLNGPVGSFDWPWLWDKLDGSASKHILYEIHWYSWLKSNFVAFQHTRLQTIWMLIPAPVFRPSKFMCFSDPLKTMWAQNAAGPARSQTIQSALHCGAKRKKAGCRWMMYSISPCVAHVTFLLVNP